MKQTLPFGFRLSYSPFWIVALMFAGWYPAWSVESPTDKWLGQIEKARRLSQVKPDSALLLYDQILAESARNQRFKLHVQVYHNLGIFYAERSQYPKALSLADSALKYIALTHDTRFEGFIYNLKANVYMQTGQNEEALKSYLTCISKAEKQGDQRLLLMVYSNLSVLYEGLTQYNKQLEYARKQFNLAVKIRNTDEIAFACAAISDYFSQTHQPDSLEKYAKLMKQACQGTQDPSLPLMLANITGSMYLAKKEYQKAIPEFRKAMVLNQQRGDSIELIRAWINLGLAYKKDGMGKMAVSFLDPATKMARRLGEKLLEREATKVLAESYAVARDFEKAYKTQMDYQALSDEALNQQSQENLQDLEARFQSEKKEANIRLLTKENALKASEAEQRKTERNLILLASLATMGFGLFLANRYLARRRLAARQAELVNRLRLSADLHDDVGATLSSISIYTEAIRTKLQNGQTERVAELVGKIGENARETVATLGDIVWNLNPMNDSAQKLFNRMESMAAILLSAQNTRLHFEVDPALEEVEFSLEAKQNLYLLYKEIINNAAKYAQASEVSASLKKSGSLLILHISDNGKGFEETTQNEGNGLRNIRKRAENWKGTASITSHSNGTSVVVSLPLAALEAKN